MSKKLFVAYALQTQCLLKVFEKDTKLLIDFTHQLQAHLELLVSAQADVAASMEQLSAFLGGYSNIHFPLTWNNDEFPALINKFQGTVAELGSWMELMVQQLQNCVLYPISKFVSRLDELQTCKESYYAACHDLNCSLMRVAKLSRKEPAKKVEEGNAEYGASRRRFHHVGLRYFVLMNSIQYQRRIGLIEPLLSILYAYRTLFRMGDQALSHDEELADFFTRVQEQIQRFRLTFLLFIHPLFTIVSSCFIWTQKLLQARRSFKNFAVFSFHVEQQADSQASHEYLKTLEEITRIQSDVYHSVDSSSVQPSFDERSRHKQGYLFLKSKPSLISRWDQMYFHTENGNLMCQGKDDVRAASRVLFELDETVNAREALNEDRRNCFTVTLGSDAKRQFVFQTLSEKECKEWISAVNNIASAGHGASSATINDQSEPVPGTRCHDVSKSVEVEVLSAPIQFDMFGLPDTDGSESFSASDKSLKQDSTDVEIFARFSTKFLGSIAVSSDRKENITVEAIKKVTHARMQYNIIRAVDLDLIILKTPPELRLLDKDCSAIKAAYRLEDIAYWTAHQNNERMFALLIKQKGERVEKRDSFTCHVLESTGIETAEEICGVLGQAMKFVSESCSS
ncbi:PH domain containing protein [Trichuris trichiura]|uniref:PH domain containing protein n=1 Tax=Trichuris trichiura TaxID=36087 RepID=A0A077YZ36_TRITR|nr:PH domain containing protein [Trichuris trichiura]